MVAHQPLGFQMVRARDFVAKQQLEIRIFSGNSNFDTIFPFSSQSPLGCNRLHGGFFSLGQMPHV
jgi:hypothetical protein